MKTKIFSILAIAIISFSAYAQIPTTGLVGHYDFNNGALTDNINNVSFTKAGSASTNITDRFGATNQAIMLNGDDLTRPDIDFNLSNSSPFLTQSISFWMKTGNNDANKRIIYSDNDQSSFADTSFDGMSVHLKDGQISAAFRDNIHSGNYFTHSTIVGDNTWYHVVVQASVTKTFGTRRIITHIYIDAVKEGGTALVTGGMGNTDPNHVGNLSFSRLKATSLSNSQKYLDGLDEVLFYNRLLTDAEVVLISTPVACTVNIPDANFKAYLVGNSLINTNGDTEIQCSEATAFTGTITVYNLGISDLTGIEAFTALTQLNCVTNQLTSLDLSANTALTSIDCRDNQLMSLDLPASIALTELKCGDNQITSLDVSANTALTDLSGHSNQLTSLDVSSNTALIDLDFDGSPITSIDVSANTALVSLAISRTQLTSIDVSTNTALEYFYATDCQLTSLDLSAQPNLELLWCNENQLTSLNIANGIMQI